MGSTTITDNDIDHNVTYGGQPTVFSIELYYGGRFTRFPAIDYVGGFVKYVHYVDADLLSVHEIDALMGELGYDGTKVMYYHFRLPNEGFDFGLRALGNDDDVQHLCRFVRDNKLMRVYTEHGNTNLLTYFMSPQGPRRVVIEEIVEAEAPPQAEPANQPQRYEIPSPELTRQEVRQVRIGKARNREKGESSCSKRLCLEWLDESNEKHNDEVPDGVEGTPYYPNIEHEAPFETEFNRDCLASGDFADFDPFERLEDHNRSTDGEDVDYEDGGMEDDMADGECNEHQDEDFLVDEENMIPDIDVDMENFYMSIDTDVEYVGVHNSQKNIVDDQVEDVEEIDNDAWESLSDDSENKGERRSLLKELGKEKTCSLGEVHKKGFHVGQKYKSKKELKDRIDMHALDTKRKLAFKKNDKLRLTAICNGNTVQFNSGVVGAPTCGPKSKGTGGPTSEKKEKGKKGNGSGVRCTWRLHASRSADEEYWFIKTYTHTHTCFQSRKIKSCTASFLSKQMVDQIETNPGVPIRSLKEQYQKKYGVNISSDKIFRAKAEATKLVVGDYTKQYTVLHDYVLELQATNPNTTVKIQVESEPNFLSTTRQFKRMYVCLGALKRGFKAGMRDFLGLDGAHMKGPFPGQVLTAVGVDSNNGIYPLAYAIVETENKDSWLWFLECLGEDLDLNCRSNFTWISDRQKGLIPALAKMFPCAEHRFCLRHIHQNMRMKWRTKEYKDFLWKCATATTVPEFQSVMKEFSEYDKEAYDWLLKIPPHHWARSHFTGRALSDMLLNNLCEVFNSRLIDGRDKPIISCLEFIREYLMKRVCNVMKVTNRSPGPLTPFATKALEKNIEAATQYVAKWNGLHKYQVKGPWHDQHVVDMSQKICSCRKWELIGIPCKHAIASINEMADSGEVVGEMYTYVHKVYWMETWTTMYSFKVEPIKGRSMWPKSQVPTTLVPPTHHIMPGRPQKKRRKSADEKSQSQSQRGKESQPVSQTQVESQTSKLSRRFMSVTCSKCKKKGHNTRTCKGNSGDGV